MPFSIYGLKPRFQDLLRPSVRWLAARDVTANQVTLAALVGSIAVSAMLMVLGRHGAPFLLLPVWFLARMALNAIDGMLAREFNQKTALGAYLNEICDVISDAVLYAPFAVIAPFNPTIIAIVVLLAMVSEFAGVLGPLAGASRRYDGPMGKSDRALVFGFLALWIGIGAKRPEWLFGAMAVVTVLLVVTIVNRIRAGLAEVTGRTSP